MKVTKEKSAEHHEAIIAAGSKLYREKGFDGVSVVEIMKAAGLTHGAFYGHFASKEALCVASLKRAFDERGLKWEERTSLSVYIDDYMSVAHRDRMGSGCPIVTFAAQIGRQTAAVRKQYTEGVIEFVDWIASRLPGKSPPSQKRAAATAILAAMVGGVVMARSTTSDRQLSARFLADSRSGVLAKFGV